MSATKFLEKLPPPADIQREIGSHLRRVAVLRRLLKLSQEAAKTATKNTQPQGVMSAN